MLPPPPRPAPRAHTDIREEGARQLILRGAILGAAAWLISAAGPSPVPPAHCDPSILVQEPHSELSYRLIEPDRDRCEGRYARNDSGGCEIAIASLTLGGRPGGPLPDPLHLSWSPPTASLDVKLRARSFRRGLHYQMDSLRPRGAQAFDWSTGLAAALELRGDDLGFVAHTPFSIAGGKEDLLLPLQFDKAGGRAQVDIVPSISIKQLYLTLFSMGPDGTARATILDAQPQLGTGGLGPWLRRTIVLPADLRGLYRLDLNADSGSGGLCAGTSAWLYISR